MKRLLSLLTITALVLTALFGCSSGGSDDGKIHLELFSNKQESIGTYKEMIKEFEKTHQNIKITLQQPPEAETVLMTRLTKNDLPDIISMGASNTFGELAKSGVLMDFSDYDKLSNIQPAYIDILGRVVGSETEGVYGIPYAVNANGVIYNKKKFKELGFKIPQTWDQFISQLEKAKAAGEIPIYFTLKTAWTAMVTWNSLGANLAPTNFAELKTNGKTTFQKEYKDVAKKYLELLKYGQKDIFGTSYSAGNKAFANGKGVFYFQGNWAVPAIQKANPDFKLGMFAFPATNNEKKNKLVSGIDVLLTISKSTEHPKAAKEFLSFMLEQEQAQKYTDEQAAFSAVKGVYQNSPIMTHINDNFKKGTITGFPDHSYPAGFGAANLVQGYLIEKNTDKFLSKLDQRWNEVLER